MCSGYFLSLAVSPPGSCLAVLGLVACASGPVKNSSYAFSKFLSALITGHLFSDQQVKPVSPHRLLVCRHPSEYVENLLGSFLCQSRLEVAAPIGTRRSWLGSRRLLFLSSCSLLLAWFSRFRACAFPAFVFLYCSTFIPPIGR